MFIFHFSAIVNNSLIPKCLLLGGQFLRPEPRLQPQELDGGPECGGGADPGGQDPGVHVHSHWHHGQEIKLADTLHWSLPQTEGLHEGDGEPGSH